MPRHLRSVFPNLPHHVTQRGNHRDAVFFGAGDHETYLLLLRDYATRYGVEVVAYCLMTNHVHLVVVPPSAEALFRTLKAVHGLYAQRINRMRELKGHLWQGRYFSSALDTDYYRNAVRYVELNPLRAGLVERAEDYRWSSAATHCGIRNDPLVKGRPNSIAFTNISNWSRWLAEDLTPEVSEMLRRSITKNLPCGSDSFVTDLEKCAGRQLRHKPAGRRRSGREDLIDRAELPLEIESGSDPS